MNILSIKLKHRTTMLVTGVVLAVVAALLIQPGVANAQEQEVDTSSSSLVVAEGSQPAYEPIQSVVVVNPGDTLWSISQQRLHPNATPQEIINEVGKIHELNRSRIRDDPNLLLVGQELLLPPLAAESAAATAPPTAPSTAPPTAEPATAVAEPTAVVGQEASAGPDEEQPTVALPDMPEAELMAVSRMGAESSLESSFLEDSSAGIQRRQLGLGVIALTIILALIMAWRLPMNRSVGNPTAWGIPTGYGYSENYALPTSPRTDSQDAASANATANATANEQSPSLQEEEENTNHNSPQNELPLNGESEEESTREQTRSAVSALQAVNHPKEAEPEISETAIESSVEELLSGTAVQDDELELARLRKLPLDEQLEIGIVLREARRQEKLPPELRQERLARVSNVKDARSFLECGY